MTIPQNGSRPHGSPDSKPAAPSWTRFDQLSIGALLSIVAAAIMFVALTISFVAFDGINWIPLAIGGCTVAIAWRLARRSRRREEMLLREISDERELIQTVIDALPESIVWKDTKSRVQGMNAALRKRMATYDVQAAPDSRISEHKMADEVAAYVAAVEEMEREVIETGEPVIDRQMTRPEADGSTSVVLRTAIPLCKEERTVGVLSTTRDITEVMELERSLASASRLESIGQLSAGVAHEINTPVQFVSDNTSFLDTSFTTLIDAISSLSELAETHEPKAVALVKKQADLDFLLEDIPDAISQSSEGLQQIAQIIRAMKAFAHPGGEITATDINTLIQSTVDVSRNEWKYHATVELDLAADLPHPQCDAGQIKQVVLNMIINAAHAIADAGEDKGVITIATATDGDRVTLRISDTGTGMSPEVQKRIFDRFFTTKGVGRGSGQGLAIAYDAITAHGGQIQVDSAVGEGTTFTIVLPVNPPQSESA